MNILVYWTYYWDEYACPERAREHILQRGYGDKRLNLNRLSQGDRAWIIGRSEDGQQWRLLQRLTINRFYTDANGTPRMQVKEASSLFFDPHVQANFEDQLLLLQFDPQRPIDATGAGIGQHIQSIRTLSEEDVTRLDAYAATLAPLM